ncbi:putative mrna cleavage factor complex component pcf11 [Diplodia seriata]|uniref:Putative mrna cleavage factor complex component pcf11 n=1 Tax=Diplodia seriata TaxID=420778 RepID=A0A0G2DPS6_9PEZI|nr:putative mrna cleavage factor complex component pcf11 [Diplodia seriata]
MSLPSAEVAADFRDALNDLKFNSRPEISNLTIIAKENTEHAQAISRELEEHIKTTRPEYKLPALYVLDSIVKNVGTPYTVYLGRNLYNTFVNTYTLVDNPTRKALEGLLRTWKQPVPESMDTRPVFPVDITRAIDNMLLKYKTVIAQQQQNQPRAAGPFPGSTRNDVELTKDSIKRPRPELIGLLYEARPNQCSTCGRRFPSGDEGKVQKRRHLDWHFKVKDPNLVKQAIHRSWYIGEKEWIEYREQDEAKPPPETNGNAAAAAKTNQQRWVRIPLDPELVNAPCPICQEKFTPSRLDDEFVWMDTIQVGPKYFHASCYEEAYGNARSTPVSILGKRPADEGANTPSKKMLV